VARAFRATGYRKLGLFGVVCGVVGSQVYMVDGGRRVVGERGRVKDTGYIKTNTTTTSFLTEDYL
jgi:hypothetical protein